MSGVVIKPDFAYAKTKAQISLAVTESKVLFLIYVKPYFQASSLLPCLYRPVCVLPCRKPRRPAFSRRGLIIFIYVILTQIIEKSQMQKVVVRFVGTLQM